MEIHIYSGLEEALGLDHKSELNTTILVKDIIKNSGQYSGLTLNVKEIITPFTDNWKNCRLQVRRGSRPGWFVIETIKTETNTIWKAT